MTARELNPNLFIVARQNREKNHALFDALNADMALHPYLILANTIRVLLIPPMLNDFLKAVRQYENTWAQEMMQYLIERFGNSSIPDIWQVRIDTDEAEAVYNAISDGTEINIAHLMQDTATQDQHLPCYPLLVRRNEERFLMPDEKFVLQCGDRILFCGTQVAYSSMQLLVQNYYVLNEMLTGQHIPRSILWRWISNRRNVARQARA
jgi:hypothetical protein